MLLFSSDLHLKVQLNFNVKLDFIQMMNGPKSCGKVDVPPHHIWLVGWLVLYFPFEKKKKKLKQGSFISCPVGQSVHTFPPKLDLSGWVAIPRPVRCWSSSPTRDRG